LSRAFADVIYRWRWPLTWLVLLGTVAVAPRVNLTDIDNDLTAWFSSRDPVYREYERFRDEFGGTRTLIVALEAPSRDRLFSPEGFEAIDDISSAIDRVGTVERVASLATATVVDARPASGPDEDAVLDVRRLMDDLPDWSPAEIGQRALDDSLIAGDLVSADGTVAAIIVFFDEARVDDVRAQVLDEIQGIVERRVPPDFQAYFNGSLEISEAYNRVTLSNQLWFTPPILLLTIVALYGMFRSWRRTLLTAFGILLAVIWTLALYDLFGFTFNVLSSMLVPLTVVLAIADDVHIIQRFEELRRTNGPEASFKGTVEHLLTPLLGATGTTALGMISLATSNVVAVRHFGLGAATGVMVDFVISIVVMPTLLSWLRPEAVPPPQETWFKGPMLAVARFSIRRSRLILVCGALATAAALAGLSRVRVDTNHINFFDDDHPLTRSAEVIDHRLAGIYAFQVFLEGPAESLRQPDALQRMHALEEALRGLPFVGKVTGLADYVRQIHGELSADGVPAIPDDPAAIAQELFVFSLADAGRAELDRVVTSDFSKAQITVKLVSMSSDLVFEQITVAERLAADLMAGTGIATSVTGSGRLFSTLDYYLVRSQISSFATAFLTVFTVIFFVFRSWRFGLLAIVPNLFPVLAVFGVMGWLDISLNVATVMLASIALGVVDDDTIHFISRYRRETRAGASTDEAIMEATAHEGRAALTTAMVNSCAFAILALSAYKPTAWFGGLLALTMIVAFLAEVFILPATIKQLPGLFGAERVHRWRRLATPGADG